jgi:hypothetical protein
MESFFSSLQKNRLNWNVWGTWLELRLAIVSWTEVAHHLKHRQLRLGKLTLIELEAVMRTLVALTA